MKTKTLVLVGTSGSGKTFLKQDLISKFSKTFTDVEQVSTREPRDENDKSYDFITKEKYDQIKDNLVGRTTFNGNQYGSKIEKFKKRKVNIILLSYEGYWDYVNSELSKDHEILTLILDRYDYKNISDIRSDRDVEFLMEEHASCLKLANEAECYYHDVTTKGFTDSEKVFDLCQKVLNNIEAEIDFVKTSKTPNIQQ